MSRKMNFVLKLLLVLTMVFSMSTVPLFATNLDVTTPMVFSNDADSRKDISSLLPSSTNDTMIWLGEFKTDSSSIQTLVSVCNNDANQYLTLYINGGSKIGFEFKGSQSASGTANVSYLDGNYHSFKLTVSPKGYSLEFDGSEVFSSNTLSIVTSMNSYTNKAMYLGAMKRQGGAVDSDSVNWYFDGTIKNVVITGKDSSIQVQPDLVYNGGNFSDGNSNKLLSDEVPDFIKNMEVGTYSITYRLDDDAKQSQSLLTLFSIMDSNGTNAYATFYVKPSTGQFGVEAREGIGHKYVNFDVTRVQNTQWHTITFTFDGNNMKVTLDDLTTLSTSASGFINGASWVSNANALLIGGMQRANNQWYFDGYVSEVRVYNSELSSDDISKLHETTASKSYPNKEDSQVFGDVETLYQPGYLNSNGYRIPSLLTTSNGTVIAGIDQRYDGLGDWYNIDSLLRRKPSDSNDFQDPIKAIDLIDFSNANDAFLIDMSLMEATLANGSKRVYMLVDMFPQCVGLVDSSLTCGSGYVTVDGTKYLALYDNDGNTYTVRDGGAIYNASGNATGYTMTVTGNQDVAYRDLGTIVDSSNNNCGNAYVYDGSQAGVFHVLKTSYLWLTYSDDDGQTWSSPKDLNGQVKADWMKFLGTGPGNGIQLENGRLVYPVYHSNVNLGGSQASAVIVSDDYGETWTLKSSPIVSDGFDSETMNSSSNILTESQVVQLNNGTLKLFMRNYSGKVKVSTSLDNGDTWSTTSQIDVFDSYCQLSALHVNYDGKEYVLISNPSASGRQNLAISVGEVNGNDITWGSKHIYHQGHGQYSCLTDLGNGNIGVLYEGHDSDDALNINYNTFSMDYLLSDIDLSAPIMSSIAATLVKGEGNSDDEIMAGDTWVYTVTFSKPVFISGDASLSLDVAGNARQADYVSGNGTSKMTFSYTVKQDDRDGAITVKKAVNVDTGEVVEGFYNNAFVNSETSVAGGSVGIDFSSDVNDLTINSASAGSEGYGAASNAYDKNEGTIWHSTDLASGWIILDLGKVCSIEGIRYLARQDGGTNGTITQYNIYVGTTTSNLTKVSNGSWANDQSSWKGDKFSDVVNGRYVKVEAVAGSGNFASAAEIAIFGGEAANIVDKTSLQATYDKALEVETKYYSEASVIVFNNAVTRALNVLNDEGVNQSEVDLAYNNLLDAINGLVELSVNVIDNSAITSSDALYSESNTTDRMFDDDLTTYWESPYMGDDAKLPQDIVLSLDGLYSLQKVSFTSHTKQNGGVVEYSVYTSVDGANWILAKTGKVDRDDYLHGNNVTVNVRFDAVDAKYVKISVSKAVGRIESEENMYARIAEMQLFGDKVISVDKSDLLSVYNSAKGLNQTAYTTSSWSNFDTAYSTAKNILDDDNASQESVDSACEALSAAINELVLRGDKTALKALVKEVNELDSSLYTTASWSSLSIAKDSVNGVLNDDDALDLDINNAISLLNTAIEKLVLRGDKTTLNALITDCDELQKDDYTTVSWNTFASVLGDVKNIQKNNDATQEDVDNAIISLQQAIKALVLRGNQKALQDLISEVEKLNKEDYTSASWNNLVKALADAKNITANKDVIQSVVDNAYNVLNDAKDSLILRSNNEALNALVDQISKLNKDDYTVESWNMLQSILSEAKAILENNDATQSVIDNAIIKLNEAKDNLITIDNTKPQAPEVKPEVQKPTNGVTTGDNASIMLFAGLLGLSSLVLMIKKRKHS